MPALDGLRGLAVLGVLLFHGGVSWVSGGFLGVDAFFVLSGFLITSLLLMEWRSTGGVGLRAFWMRRARRLLPALLVVLAAVCALTPLLDPASYRRLGGDALAAVGYVANWRLLSGGGDYFAQNAPPSPLQHTWSLAIEEQFYLLWPLVVVLALRRLRRPLRALLIVSLAGAAGSAALMALLYREGDPGRAYYGTDTRAQCVLVGCALAVALTMRPTDAAAPTQPRPAMRIAGLVGAAGSLLLWTGADGATAFPYRGGLTLAALCAALVVAGVVLDPAGPLARGLAWTPLRALGRISYGVYLWHWPLFLVLTSERTGLTGADLLAARVAVTLAAATMSYTLLERPVLAGALAPRRVLAGLAAATAAVLVLATTAAGRAPAPLPDGQLVADRGPAGDEPALAEEDPGPAPADEEPGLDPAAAAPGGAAAGPSRSGPGATAPANGVLASAQGRRAPGVGSPPGQAGQPVRVLLLGDSVALTLGRGLARVDSAHGVELDNSGVLGCGIANAGDYRYFGAQRSVPEHCDRELDGWARTVAQEDPDVVVLLAGRWEVMDRKLDGRWLRLGDPEYDAHLDRELERLLPVLTARGAPLVLLSAPYYLRGERPDGGRFPEDDPARVDTWNALLRSFAARHPGRVSVVDFGAKLSPDGRYTRSIGDLLVRYDGVHITPRAGRWLAPWLLPQLTVAARS